MTGLRRHMESKIARLLKQFPVVCVVGARQCGKTTLARRVQPDWTYVDLEDPATSERVQHDARFFLQQFPRQVILDEVQGHPHLFQALRGAIDEQRSEKGRYILTGSSSPELLRHTAESLAGRVAIVHMGTLKASELASQPLSPFYQLFANKLDADILLQANPPALSLTQVQQAWFRGGYPEPVLAQDEDFYRQWMDNYQRTYLERDIPKLFPHLNHLTYRRFLTMLSHLSGTIVNKRNLARALEVSEGAVRGYLEIAAGTFLWRGLPSFEGSGLRSVVKMPKGHLCDTGLLHFLLQLAHEHDLQTHPIVGASFEAFVVEEILKGLQATSVVGWQAHHYRTRGGAEIDLVLQGAFGVLPIEIKRASRVNMRSLQSLSRFVQQLNLPFGVLVNQSQQLQWLTPHVLQLPATWL
ncbi:MAG: ATP-binding protein [Myxococcota bacterium]